MKSPEADPAPASPSEFTTPRRLHPASMLLGIPAGTLIQGVFIPLFAILAAGGIFTVILLALFAVFSVVSRGLGWYRRFYSFDGEVLRVDSGVLGRSHRSLDVDRIQQIEIERGLLQRLLGLAAVRVETAGSASEPEVELRVIRETEARTLRTAIRRQKARLRRAREARGQASFRPDRRPRGSGDFATPEGAGREGVADRPREWDRDEDAEVRHELLRVPELDVVIASVTGARLMVFPALIGAALQLLSEAMAQFTEWAEAQLRQVGSVTEPLLFSGPDWRWIVPLVLLSLLVSVVAAAIFGLLRDGRFRVDRIGDDLHISRGLLSTRESVVPLSRIQIVQLRRSWLRRLLGYATVELRSAGGSTGEAGRVTIPLLPLSRVDEVLAMLLPGIPGLPPLTPHPPAALRRTLFRRLRGAAVLIALAWFVPGLVEAIDPDTALRIGWGSLLLVPAAAALAWIEYRHLAHGLTEMVVVSRRGALSISTTLGPVRKVQAVTALEGPFQRRLDLGSLQVHVAGPGARIEIRDAGAADTRELHTRLTTFAAGGEGAPQRPRV